MSSTVQPLPSEQMRARERRAFRARALAIALIVGALPTLLSCRQSGATQRPRPWNDTGLKASDVEPPVREAWEALAQARATDPAAPEVVVAADELLQLQPPLQLELQAHLAKAEQAYRVGRDPQAILVVDEALSGLQPPAGSVPAVLVELSRVRLRAMVRGGDPARALVALDEPWLSTPGALEQVERLGLRAVALDRNGQYADALVAYARWRAQLGSEAPAAVYAEQRMAVLGRGVDPDALVQRLAELPSSLARQCVAAKAGHQDPPADAPPWVARCGGGASRIGILLPRTGRLSALADTQLAAAAVAVPLLLREVDGSVEVLWRDAGSTQGTAVAGARELVAAGADIIVGPVGSKSVRAVTAGVASGVPVVVPGESLGRAQGVAPSLEARVHALVHRARGQGARRFVVATPANAYGKRAVKALQGVLEDSERKSLIIQEYEPSTTSFAPVVAPLLPALNDKAALLVPDHVSRVELLVRQLARSGRPPTLDGKEGALILSTAEGASPAALGAGHEILENLWVSPTAAESEDTEAFVQAYLEQEGEPPGDQALLVYWALRRALLGSSGRAKARALAVQGGRLVPSPPPPA